MKKIIAALLCACLMVASGTVVNASQLTIATEESPPSSYYQDGKLTGSSVEVVQEIQRRLGDTTPINVWPWARGYKTVQEKPNVALFACTRTEARENMFQWVGPLIRLKWAFYGKKGSTPAIASLDDAKQVKRIGTYRDDAREQFLKKNGFTNLDSTSENEVNMKKLMAGRINLAVSTNLGVATQAQAAGVDPHNLEEAFIIKQADLYIAFSKDTDPAIVNKWQATLKSMQEDGTFQKLYTKWFPTETAPEIK